MRIITGRRAEQTQFVMPTDEQLDRLHAVVVRKHPRLGLPPGATEKEQQAERRAFKNAFLAVGYLGRREEPESRNAHALSWWVDHVNGWLRDEDVSGEVTQTAFVAAVLAHNDVPHHPLDRYPFDVLLGLTVGGAGRRAGDKWKQVLATNELLPPIERPQAAHSHSNVQRVGAIPSW